jgi:hypothetical protein
MYSGFSSVFSIVFLMFLYAYIAINEPGSFDNDQKDVKVVK